MKNIIFILNLILFNIIYAECYELNYAECLYWSYYCEWNDETDQCQEIGGGGGGGDLELGPYDFETITESDGLRNGPDYYNGILYYPIDAEPPFKSIIFTPGFGGGSTSMADWAEYFVSYGFTAMIIGPNDEINDSHQMRAEGLIDAIETIKQENERIGSPLYDLIDSMNFIVAGYSMGGGASQIALTLEHPHVDSIVSGIALNPTILIEDCDICADYDYCICLVPEFLEHDIPTLIVAGQFELNELPDYDGLLGQDIYENTSETTIKMLFEVAGGGHGSSYEPEVREKALQWAKYHLLNDSDVCETLIEEPNIASDFQTTLSCEEQLPGDVNGDTLVNVQDVILMVNLILNNQYDDSADLNSDNTIDVLDIVQLVNIILN